MRVLVPKINEFRTLAENGALHIPETEIAFYDRRTIPEGEFDGVVTLLAPVEQVQQLLKVPQLRWVLTLTAGIDHVKPFLPPQVSLYKAPDLHAKTVALHVLAGMLSAVRGLHLFRDAQQQANWQPRKELGSLLGKKVVIWGHGHIGHELARQLEGLGAIVDGFNSKTPSDLIEYRLPEADHVVLLLPSTEQTRGLINAKLISTLKHSVWLHNSGRGDLVVTDDLLAALRNGQLGGAVLDVTDPEPLPPEHPLWKQKNVIITPHIAGMTEDVMLRSAQYIRDFLLDMGQNRELSGLVTHNETY